jgi:hypothetical protein
LAIVISTTKSFKLDIKMFFFYDRRLMMMVFSIYIVKEINWGLALERFMMLG